MSETGKAYEEALVAEIGYAEAAFGFWAANAEKYLAEEKVRSASPFVKGRKLIVRYAPVGVVGVIGPWNYPLTNSFGDSIPAMVAGNSVLLKPSEVTPLTSLLMGEMLRECGLPEDVYQVLPGYGETAAAMIDEVDFVMFTGSTATGKKVMERAAQTLTPVVARAGRQGPDDRVRGRRRRAGRERRGALLDAERRPDVHLDRARVRRGADLRRVRAARAERVRDLRQSAPGGPGSRRPRRGDQPAAGGHHRAARERRGGEGRARAGRRQPARRERALLRADACSWTWTTRWRACARRRSGRRCRS